ncbi:MAG TPA: hypothetical protein VK453_25150 [Micromonosporaceae bacterium]|nr:hypothetical protein [Micromonosporaceae bacterium]
MSTNLTGLAAEYRRDAAEAIRQAGETYGQEKAMALDEARYRLDQAEMADALVNAGSDLDGNAYGVTPVDTRPGAAA